MMDYSHLNKWDHIHSNARGIVISAMAGYDLNNDIMDSSTYANSIGWLLWVCMSQ